MFICMTSDSLFVLKIFKFLSRPFGHAEKMVWLERQGWVESLSGHNLVNKQFQYTDCPISHKVKATRQVNLVS